MSILLGGCDLGTQITWAEGGRSNRGMALDVGTIGTA